MLLTATNQKLQLTTSAASAVDVVVSFVEHSRSAQRQVYGSQATAITTATTTDVLAAPASGWVRQVLYATITVTGVPTQTVTLVKDVGGTDYALTTATLATGTTLQVTPTGIAKLALL